MICTKSKNKRDRGFFRITKSVQSNACHNNNAEIKAAASSVPPPLRNSKLVLTDAKLGYYVCEEIGEIGFNQAHLTKNPNYKYSHNQSSPDLFPPSAVGNYIINRLVAVCLDDTSRFVDCKYCSPV